MLCFLGAAASENDEEQTESDGERDESTADETTADETAAAPITAAEAKKRKLENGDDAVEKKKTKKKKKSKFYHFNVFATVGSQYRRFKYSGDLKNIIPYSNGPKQSNQGMVCYSDAW